MNQYIQNSNKLKEAIKKRLIIAKNEIDDAEIESEKNILDEFINLSVDNIYQTINLIINSSVDRIFHQAVIDRIIENRDIGLNQYSISILRLLSEISCNKYPTNIEDNDYWYWLEHTEVKKFLSDEKHYCEVSLEYSHATLKPGKFNSRIWPREASIKEVILWLTKSKDKATRDWANQLNNNPDWPPPFIVVKEQISQNEIIESSYYENILETLKDYNNKEYERLKSQIYEDENVQKLIAFCLIYLAEKDVIEKRDSPIFRLDTTNASFKTFNGLSKIIDENIYGKLTPENLVISEEDEILLLIPEYNKPSQIQLTLPLKGISNEEIIQIISERFNYFTLRNYLAILTLMSTKGGAIGKVLWTLDDHLFSLNEPSWRRKPEQRNKVRESIRLLTKLKLAIRVKLPNKSGWVTQQIISIENNREFVNDNWDLEAAVFILHPELNKGVRAENGNIGTNFFPLNTSLPTLKEKEFGQALKLAPHIACRMRWQFMDDKDSGKEPRPYITYSGHSLYKAASIPLSSKRHKRSVNRLRKNLDELIKKDIIGHYEWVDGPAWGLNSNCRINWPQRAKDILLHEVLPSELYPINLPTNGFELKEWRNSLRLSQSELANTIGVSLRTIKRSETEKATLPLGPSLRKALPKVQKVPKKA
jgi:DNA-binding XRE family transcriptional regulator